jgi:hypothetical protein
MSSCDLFQQCIQVQISLQFHKMAMRRMKKASAKKAKKSVMKAMRRRKAKKVSKRTAVRQVLKGTRQKTIGGLSKGDLTKNKHGRVVSKKKSAFGKKSKWIAAVGTARRQLGVKGFQAVGGKSATGQALLKKARSIYKK